MSRNLGRIVTIVSSLLVFALLGGLIWANSVYVRHQPRETGFLVPWLGARTYLQAGTDPYSEPAAQRAQIQYYGQLASEGQDPLRLSLPFPALFFYFPLAMVTDYPLARGIWMTIIQTALVGLAFLTLNLTGWKPGRIILPLILLFSILWVYGFLCLASGNGTALVTLGIAGTLICLRDQRDELAGVLLVLPFLKLDVAGIFVVFILWQAVNQRRWRVLAGFLMTLVFLLAISFIFFSSWFLPFLSGVVSHYRYTPGQTPGNILASFWPAIGGKLGWIMTGILAIVLVFEWRIVRGKDFRHFLWTACLSLTATPLLGIPLSAVDFVVLFIPLIFTLTILDERWARPGRLGIGWILMVILFCLQWIWIFGRLTPAALRLGLDLVLPFVMLVGLYWMRWWVIHPPRTWLEDIKDKVG